MKKTKKNKLKNRILFLENQVSELQKRLAHYEGVKDERGLRFFELPGKIKPINPQTTLSLHYPSSMAFLSQSV